MEEVDDGMGMEEKGGQEQDPGTCVDTDLQLQDEDQRLLAMLEEANRALEMDRKSCPTLTASPTTPDAQKMCGSSVVPPTTTTHCRKGSESSLVSSNSSASQLSNQISCDGEEGVSAAGETLHDVWDQVVHDWDSYKKKPLFVKELVRKNIPQEFRGIAWQLLAGAHNSSARQLYAEYLKKSSPCEKLISRDIARTFPEHDFFKEKDGGGQESLFNVMKAYSIHDREVGYCQGIGFIVGLLLMEMPEEDAFTVLVHLMQDYRLREIFKPSMAELGVCMYKLEYLIQELLPTLHVHFQTQNFDTSMYASSWFLTLFTTTMPLSLARRVMDLFTSEGMEVVFRVAMAILQSCQEDLLTLDMEGLLQYLQRDLRNRFESDIDQELLLQVAFQVRYSPKKLKKLEKDYSVLRTKQNEDQVELRRLRTENRLLRQRIDNLEQESASLADKLVQDQVTRAQEAEEVYALKNQLSVTQQQLRDTHNKLEEAEDIIGDIRRRTHLLQGAVQLDEEEEKNVVQHLQEELIAVRLREAETIIHIKDLNNKISELQDTNMKLQRAPSNDVQHLQEELIAVKLREAESNLSLKELQQKVQEIETYWQSHMERMAEAAPVTEKSWRTELRNLQQEVMTVKLREAKSLAELKDTKQKVMELETQNHISQNQIRRMNEVNKDLQTKLDEAAEKERELRSNLKDITRKLDDTESKRKEETMMARIKEAENIQLIAELRHQLAEIDIHREEKLTADQLQDQAENEYLEGQLHDLHSEMMQLQKTADHDSTGVMSSSFLTAHESDEEWDKEVRDSENLDRTLSDIIEGKSPLTKPSKPIPRFSSLDNLDDCVEGSSNGVEDLSADGNAHGGDDQMWRRPVAGVLCPDNTQGDSSGSGNLTLNGCTGAGTCHKSSVVHSCATEDTGVNGAGRGLHGRLEISREGEEVETGPAEGTGKTGLADTEETSGKVEIGPVEGRVESGPEERTRTVEPVDSKAVSGFTDSVLHQNHTEQTGVAVHCDTHSPSQGESPQNTTTTTQREPGDTENRASHTHVLDHDGEASSACDKFYSEQTVSDHPQLNTASNSVRPVTTVDCGKETGETDC